MGLRPISIAIVTSSWDGSATGRGTQSRELLQILESSGQNPKVREVGTEELALNNIGKGALTVGPITPDFPGGGTALDNLKPQVDRGETVHVLVQGPGYGADGTLYLIKTLNADRALHWTMVIQPVQAQNP